MRPRLYPKEARPETRGREHLDSDAVAVRELTGEDLSIEDVWAVAVDGAPAELADSARAKMLAARELVDRAAHGASEHTYGINTGFGRFVSESIPPEQTRSPRATPARARRQSSSCSPA